MKFNNLELFKLSKILIEKLLKDNLINQTEFEKSVAELKKIYNIQNIAFE